MCHLVTFFKPANANAAAELNLLQTVTFDTEEAAKDEASAKALSGCTEVRVWKFIASATRQTVVEWS